MPASCLPSGEAEGGGGRGRESEVDKKLDRIRSGVFLCCVLDGVLVSVVPIELLVGRGVG